MAKKTTKFWRMQLHPNRSDLAARFSAQNLSAGFIGLDFAEDVGELWRIRDKTQLRDVHRDYWEFAHEVKIGDPVLIICHHHLFALVIVASEYKYVSDFHLLGTSFKHFRRVKDTRYYFDYETNPKKWERLTMTDGFAKLESTESKSYQLMEKWLKTNP